MVNLLVKTFEHNELEKLDAEVNDWSKERDVRFVTPYSREGCHCKQVLYLELEKHVQSQPKIIQYVPEEGKKEIKQGWYKCTTCGKFVTQENKDRYGTCSNKHTTLVKV